MNRREAQYISPKTRAEMACGAKQVEAAKAWAAADVFETKLRAKYGKDNFEVQVHAVRMADDSYELLTRVFYPTPTGTAHIDLPVEPLDVFPSPTLQTQIMLVLG